MISFSTWCISSFYVFVCLSSSTFVVVSNPAKFKYDQFDDDNNRTDVTRLYGTWKDVDLKQYADTLSCSWAMNGING